MNLKEIHQLTRKMSQTKVLPVPDHNAALSSPVFMVELPQDLNLSSDALEFLETRVFQEHTGRVLSAPFPWLRLHVSNESWDDRFFLHDLRTEWPTSYIVFDDQVRKARNDRGRMIWEGWLDWRPIPSTAMRAFIAHEVQRKGNQFECDHLRPLAWLLALIHLPNSAVLRVGSKTQGKSVHWHKSREHWVVLPRRIASAMASNRRSATALELRRAAHWRRAHFRRLMSAAYRHKMGQVVPVKASWVGPHEWTGSDKKTYSVVTLPSACPRLVA